MRFIALFRLLRKETQQNLNYMSRKTELNFEIQLKIMILRTMLRDSKYPENQLIDFENTVSFAKKNFAEGEHIFHRVIHVIFEQV